METTIKLCEAGDGVMQRKGKGIAILAEDHCEDPELWEIFWRAVLAPDDQQNAQSCRTIPHGRDRVADLPTGHNNAKSSRARMNNARNY
jgi:hypothetical protein